MTVANSDFICSQSDAWSLNSSDKYEVSCWVRPIASNDGNIFALFNGSTQILALKLNSSLKLQAIAPSLALNLESSAVLSLNTWHFVQLQISGSAASILLDGGSTALSSITRADLSATEARIGGFKGMIDEFVFRTSLTTGVPTEPLQGTITAASLGGFGAGELGDVVITQDTTINTTSRITGTAADSSGGTAITVSNVNSGKFGSFFEGAEVIVIDPDSGTFQFSTVKHRRENIITIFDRLNVQITPAKTLIVCIPHFRTLTVPAGRKIHSEDGFLGFRCSGNCTVEGTLLSAGLWRERAESAPVCHADMPDKFAFGGGGAMFIMCGGTFTATASTALIGAEGCAPSGFGGLAGNMLDDPRGYPVGLGMNSGQNPLQTQDTRPGYSGTFYYQTVPAGFAGPSVILIARTLCVEQSVLHFGGSNGMTSPTYSTAGGGSGFCYIACERMA